MTKFGRLLKKLRLRERLSQAALAKSVNIDTSYISRLEKGNRLVASRKLLAEIGKVLNLSGKELDLWFFSAGYISPRLQEESSQEISRLIDG